MAELQPTYGNFTLRGQVVWLDRNNAYDENTSENGYLYRRIRFGVKTEEKNIVQVELFQTKFDTVTLQNKETKQRDKEVPYGEHHNLPEGYQLFMPIRLGIEQDEEGNNIKKQLIPFDAIKYIKENLKNGDTVFIFGSPRFSEYTDRDGNVVPQVAFEPRGIYLASTPYEDEEFEGQSTFEQTIVLNRTVKQDDKLMVHAYIINDKHGNFVPHTFYIDIKKFKKFAMNVHKLKFGTVLNAEGIIHHTVEEKEVEQDDAWGESPVKNTITNVIKSLEITRVDKPSKEDIAKYTKDDFVKKPKEEEPKDDNPFNEDDDDWGSSPSDDDPFVADDDPFADL